MKEDTIIHRLANVIYWVARFVSQWTIIAAVIGGIYLAVTGGLTADVSWMLVATIVFSVLIWLAGRAILYILSGV